MSSNVREVNHLHEWQCNFTILIVDISLSLKRNEFTLTRPAHSPTEATNDNWESSNKLQKAVPRESQRKPQWCCQRTFQRLATWCNLKKKREVWNLGGFELLDEFVLEKAIKPLFWSKLRQNDPITVWTSPNWHISEASSNWKTTHTTRFLLQYLKLRVKADP